MHLEAPTFVVRLANLWGKAMLDSPGKLLAEALASQHALGQVGF